MWDSTRHSDYFKSLNVDDKKAYKTKLTLKSGETLPDPCTLKDDDWQNERELMPDFQMADLQIYLLNTPSPYTHEAIKAYKSLEAYNFFHCGHVHDVYLHKIKKDSEFCFIKTKVIVLLCCLFYKQRNYNSLHLN